ncbi:MAG: low molecular weight phosphotyrosine protein phosphatase [Candidatus Cloacimonetes bacterium]|nr:low molecular weight phosphotyrosine protein phosphatase [Candidatus Cloacimonadota bacterium]
MKKIRVLFVCLGNICRSPAAEGVLIHKIKEAGLSDRIEVDSAGTGTWHLGKSADPRMLEAAKNRGIHLPSICRQVTKEDFCDFDWIVAMDGDNLKNLTALRPNQASAHLVPMREFVKSREISGIPDPYFGGAEGFELVLDLLDEGCSNLLRNICETGRLL